MKIKLWAATNLVGSKVSTEIEVDEDDWNNMSDMGQEEYMVNEFWQSGLVDWGEE